MQKTVIQPAPFTYNGATFTPVVSNEKYDFSKLSNMLWGGEKNLKRLDYINNGYSYKAFYAAAKKAGCGKVDVFIVDGEKVIPAGGGFFYYGAPNWYIAEQKREEYKQAQADYIREEVKKLEAAMLKTLDGTFEMQDGVPQEFIDKGGVQIGSMIISAYTKKHIQ